MFAASKTGGVVAGTSGDPYWTSVSLLTNFENNLTFQDESTNNFAITRTGTVNPSLNTPFSGGVGGSEYFNGSTGYLTWPSGSTAAFGTGNFTVECWVYLTSAPTINFIIDFRDATHTTAPIFLWGDIVSGVLYWDKDSSGVGAISGTATWNTNTWYHVAYVRNGTTGTLYQNGVSIGSGTDSTNYTVVPTTSTIGNRYALSYYYPGFLSNVRIVKGTAVYTSAFTPPTAPLTAITNTSLLITGTGQGMFNNATFVDQGPNALTVTATGAPVYSGLSPFGNTYAGSVLYNGSSQYLSTPTNSVFDFGTGDLTMEAWIYITGVPAAYLGTYSGVVVSKNTDNTNLGFYFTLTATSTAGFTGLEFRQYYSVPNSEVISRSFTFAQNTWYHLAVSKQSGSVKLFINGTQQGATATFTQSQLVSTAQVTTGGQSFSGGYNYYFPGNISNLRIVKGTAVYTANFTPSTTPLTAITNTSLLVRGDTGAFYDLSNNGLAETGVGSPVVTTQVKKFGNESINLSSSSLATTNTTALQMGTGDYTVEFWVYQTSVAGTQVLVEVGRSGVTSTPGFQIDTIGGVVTVYGGSAISTLLITSGSTQIANQWYHIALTRSGSSTRLFINGTQSGSTATDSTNYTQGYFWGGANAGGVTAYLAGNLDDIRITKGVARYTANFTPPTATFPTGP